LLLSITAGEWILFISVVVHQGSLNNEKASPKINQALPSLFNPQESISNNFNVVQETYPIYSTGLVC